LTDNAVPCFWVIVPTYNPGQDAWLAWLRALQNQHYKPSQVVVVDSSSSDGTPELSLQAGHTLLQIQASNFNHGATRQWALDQALQSAKNTDATLPEFVVYLTQDAILAEPDSLQKLLSAFQKPMVHAAFGRQLPQAHASWIERLTRSFNYPAQSRMVSLKDKVELGIKTCFFSNAYAAYRLQSLMRQGGFPGNLPLGEDSYIAAKLLIEGYSIQYQADAQVYHSHQYSANQDFCRMFDTGVFHQQNPWLLQTFGKAEGEGLRLLKLQARYLFQQKKSHSSSKPPFLLFGFIQLVTTSAAKFLGYQAGRLNPFMPLKVKQAFSMHPNFWSKKQ
jgi:rhamnosyltransferase